METNNVCAVIKCAGRYTSKLFSALKRRNISFFRFPKDIERCRKWVDACGQRALLESRLAYGETLYNSYYRICSLHFEESMYASSKKRKLHADAVPTLLLGNESQNNLEHVIEEEDNTADTEETEITSRYDSTPTTSAASTDLLSTGTQTEKAHSPSEQEYREKIKRLQAEKRSLRRKLRVEHKRRNKLLKQWTRVDSEKELPPLRMIHSSQQSHNTLLLTQTQEQPISFSRKNAVFNIVLPTIQGTEREVSVKPEAVWLPEDEAVLADMKTEPVTESEDIIQEINSAEENEEAPLSPECSDDMNKEIKTEIDIEEDNIVEEESSESHCGVGEMGSEIVVKPEPVWLLEDDALNHVKVKDETPSSP